MTKKNSRMSMRDLIVNQATSTMDDLYAKRNALLSMEKDQFEANGSGEQTSEAAIIYSANSNMPLDMPDDTSNIDQDKDILEPNKIDLTSLEFLTNNVVKNNLSTKNIPPIAAQVNLTGHNNSTIQLVDNNPPVKSYSPTTGQTNFTNQSEFTIKITKIIQAVGLTGAGTLMLLHSLVGHSGGYIRTRNLARDLGMTYQALLNQLERLVNAGFVDSPPGNSMSGRWLEITLAGQLYLTSQLNYTTSSSSFNNNTTTDNESDILCLTSQLNLTDQINLTSLPESTSQLNFTPMLSWERTKLRNDAEDLFYIALVARIEAGILSMQALRLYGQISKEKSKDYAAALFLILLPKVKDNPAGYIHSAFKQGAEPNADSLKKVKEMQEILECMVKAYSPEEAKQQMQSALDNGDTQTILSLAKQQEKYKKALDLLSWRGTFEALIQKRDEFVSSLLR